jgi:hypothetical protein
LAVGIKKTEELLDIKTTKVWELIAGNELETVSIGKRRLVLYASIEALIERLRKAAAAQPRRGWAERAIEASLAARRSRRRGTFKRARNASASG